MMVQVGTRAVEVKGDGGPLQRRTGVTVGVDIGGTKVAVDLAAGHRGCGSRWAVQRIVGLSAR